MAYIEPTRADVDLQEALKRAAIAKQKARREQELASGKSAKRVSSYLTRDFYTPVAEAPVDVESVLDVAVEPPEIDLTTGIPASAEVGGYSPDAAAPIEQGLDTYESSIGELRRARGAAIGALGDIGGVEKRKAKLAESQLAQQALLEDQQTANYEAQVATYEALQRTHQLASERADKEMREAEESLSSYKIDPNRAYGSVGGQVASALAIAVGAFAQGLSGNRVPNTALRIIEGAIKRDIDAQKAEMGKRADVLRNKNNIYAQMLSKFGREDIAEKMAMNLGLKKAQMDLTSLLTKHKSQAAQITGEGLMRNLDAKIADVKGAFAKAYTEVQMNKAKHAATLGRRAGVAGSTDPVAMAGSVLNQIPSLMNDFLKVPRGAGITVDALPRWFTRNIPSEDIGEAITYQSSRTLMAKEITAAFDGKRPTDKDFSIIAAVIPTGGTFKKTGVAQFNKLYEKLMQKIAAGGGLKRGMIAAVGAELGIEGDDETGAAWAKQAEAEQWGYIGFQAEAK